MDSFKTTLAEVGLFPEVINPTGKIERFAVDGKNKNGWYWLNESNGNFYGCYGDWSRGISEKYTSYPTDNPVEIAKLNKEFEIMRKEASKLKKEEQREAGQKARCMWEGMKTGNHPYLVKKKIHPHGTRKYKNSLVIPMFKNGQIVSLQFISSEGKRFLSGGETLGAAYVIDGSREYAIICEGFSTGATIYEATGFKVFISFSASNMVNVAKRVREIMPNTKIIIACDNDTYKDKNVGVLYGEKAAKISSGILSIPKFSDTRNKPTDYNDLFMNEGLKIVKQQIIPETSVFEQSIRDWCGKFNGTFTVNELLNHFSIMDIEMKNKVDSILLKLCKENYIEADQKKRSIFRRVDTELKRIIIDDDVSITGVDIVLPFGLSERVVIEEANVIVFAGESNTGKTAIFIKNMLENILQSNIFSKPVYLSSEMGKQEVKARVNSVNSDNTLWNQAEIYERSGNFHDVISKGMSEKLVYIDLLEASSNLSYAEIEGAIKSIKDSLTTGVAIIALQKSKGQRLARGGDGTLAKARLYIALHHCYKGINGIVNRAIIEKCKMVQPGERNPEGMQLFFQITKTGNIELITHWAYLTDTETALNTIKNFNPEASSGLDSYELLPEYKEFVKNAD